MGVRTPIPPLGTPLRINSLLPSNIHESSSFMMEMDERNSNNCCFYLLNKILVFSLEMWGLWSATINIERIGRNSTSRKWRKSVFAYLYVNCIDNRAQISRWKHQLCSFLYVIICLFYCAINLYSELHKRPQHMMLYTTQRGPTPNN